MCVNCIAPSLLGSLSTFNLINYIMILIQMTKLSSIKQLRRFIGFNVSPVDLNVATTVKFSSIKKLTNCLFKFSAARQQMHEWGGNHCQFVGFCTIKNIFVSLSTFSVVDKFHYAGGHLKINFVIIRHMLVVDSTIMLKRNFMTSWHEVLAEAKSLRLSVELCNKSFSHARFAKLFRKS